MLAERSLFHTYATIFIFCLMCEHRFRRPHRLTRRLGETFRVLRKFFSLKVGRLHPTLLLLATLCAPAGTTTAFDCEANNAKLATISLEAVGGCTPFNATYGEAETVEVQVLQRSHKMSLPAYSCSLRISREICTCRHSTYWRSFPDSTPPTTTPAHPWVGKSLVILLTIVRTLHHIAATACQYGIGLLALLNVLAGLFFIILQRHNMVAQAAHDAVLLLFISWAPSAIQLYYIRVAIAQWHKQRVARQSRALEQRPPHNKRP